MTRIVSFREDNFKRLEALAVELDPDNNFIEVTGRNAQGKTSLIDGLIAVFDGAAIKKANSKVVREGADKAVVSVELDNGLVITRTFRPDGSFTVKVQNSDGRVHRSPQKILDDLVGRLTFDPLAYMAMKPSEQYEILLSLNGFNFDEVDAKRAEAYEERTDVNREVKKLRAQIDAIPEPSPGTPVEPVSITQLAEDFRAAQAIVTENAGKRADLERRHVAIHGLEEDASQIRQEIARLQNNLDVVEANIAAERSQVDALTSVVDELVDPDTSAIQEAMASAEETNIMVSALLKRDALEQEYDSFLARVEELTAVITQIDQFKKDSIDAAEFPVDGVGIDSETKEVMYNGIPLSSCSGAERLTISTAMGIATNPELKVMFIKDGSLLDSEGRRILAEIADENNTQIWIERVDESGENGIVIEGGSVVNIEPSVGVDVLDHDPFEASDDAAGPENEPW